MSNSIALTVLSLTLGLFFIMLGQFKVTPKFFPDVHEDMRREFGRLNKVFPFYQVTGWRPFAKNYRFAFGLLEIICGTVLVIIHRGIPSQIANVVLLTLMLTTVYTHYALHDKFERMAPSLVFSLLLLTRLIINRQVQTKKSDPSVEKQKINKLDKKDVPKSVKENKKQSSEDESAEEDDNVDVDDENDSVEEIKPEITPQKSKKNPIVTENKKKK